MVVKWCIAPQFTLTLFKGHFTGYYFVLFFISLPLMIVSGQIALWSPAWRLTSSSLHSWHYVKVNGCKNISSPFSELLFFFSLSLQAMAVYIHTLSGRVCSAAPAHLHPVQ